MNEVETIQIENEKLAITRKTGVLRRIINVTGLTLVWAFISAMIVGSLAAAIWTVIPTDLLAWGAGELNRMGYVSHCSYAPLSTLILLTVGGVGARLAHRLKSGRRMGRVVFGGTAGGLVFGALMGIDIVMFIGMGIGLGIGIIFGLIIGVADWTRENKEARV